MTVERLRASLADRYTIEHELGGRDGHGLLPRLLIHFDDPTHPSYRTQWALGRDRVYVPVQDRQSDVWVMDLKQANTAQP